MKNTNKNRRLAALIFSALMVIVAAILFHLGDTETAGVITMAGPLAIGDVKLARRLAKYSSRNYVKSPGYLRIEQTLENGKGLYEFAIRNDTSTGTTEKKLDRNDLFIVEKVGVFLYKEVTTTKGINPLVTYPNSTYFGTQSGFTVAHLNTIYNAGELSLKIQNRTNIENWSLNEFLWIDTSQKSASIGFDEWKIEKATRSLKFTNLELRGTQDITFSIKFPTFSSMQIAATASSTNHKLVLCTYGILIKGAAIEDLVK